MYHSNYFHDITPNHKYQWLWIIFFTFVYWNTNPTLPQLFYKTYNETPHCMKCKVNSLVKSWPLCTCLSCPDWGAIVELLHCATTATPSSGLGHLYCWCSLLGIKVMLKLCTLVRSLMSCSAHWPHTQVSDVTVCLNYSTCMLITCYRYFLQYGKFFSWLFIDSMKSFQGLTWLLSLSNAD